MFKIIQLSAEIVYFFMRFLAFMETWFAAAFVLTDVIRFTRRRQHFVSLWGKSIQSLRNTDLTYVCGKSDILCSRPLLYCFPFVFSVAKWLDIAWNVLNYTHYYTDSCSHPYASGIHYLPPKYYLGKCPKSIYVSFLIKYRHLVSDIMYILFWNVE